MTRFWCGVISRDHIQRGLAGGFCQSAIVAVRRSRG